MSTTEVAPMLEKAKEGIARYLDEARVAGRIDQGLYDAATANTYPNLEKWLTNPEIDRVSPNLKSGILDAIEAGNWTQLVNAFRQNVRFGTGGIRGMMAFDKASIQKLYDEGVGARILKGPNTINDLVFLLTSAGVAQFGKEPSRNFQKVVIGYDSRIRGHDLAKLNAQLFLAYGYTVYFFDDPCPYPEVTFAIPHEWIKADIGILVSASHNDYRYNGYKLSCANGSQFDPKERDEMYNEYIAKAKPADIKLCPFEEAEPDRLIFLGGDAPVPEGERVQGFSYAGREDKILNIHKEHADHMKAFLLTADLAERQKSAEDPLHIGFCAYHGAGNKAVPRLLEEVGFVDVKPIHHGGLNDLNGFFPSFKSDPGEERQPDPGDPRAAAIAVEAFKAEYGQNEFDRLDVLLGTDPDADRTGVVVKVPANQRQAYSGQDHVMLMADDVWQLLLWYRLHREAEQNGGTVPEAEKKFVSTSHTTIDGIIYLAEKFGLGAVKTWVGFASLAAAVRDVWDQKLEDMVPLVEGRSDRYVDKCHPFFCQAYGIDAQRSINVAALEQSNGWSILGGPPPDARSLGVNGHVRDKDGTFAALLVAEAAAWAKEQGKSIIELLDEHVYLDPDIGLFMTFYEPDPLDGEYPGIEGDRIKKSILRRALGFYQLALAGDLSIAGMPVTSAVIYRTGKYDTLYPPTHDWSFPDEGVRFYFDEDLKSHLTIRPSGTGNSLRFHVQLHAQPTKANLIEVKTKLRAKGRAMLDELRTMLKAPRPGE